MVREAAAFALKAPDSANEAGKAPPFDLVDRVLAAKKVPIFTILTVCDLVAVAQSVASIQCERGKVVIREGDQGDALYLIMSGEFLVVKGLGTNRETLLARLYQNDFFGEMALFDGGTRSASVMAESEGYLLKLDAGTFETMVKEHPTIPVNVCKLLSRRIRELQAKMNERRTGRT